MATNDNYIFSSTNLCLATTQLFTKHSSALYRSSSAFTRLSCTEKATHSFHSFCFKKWVSFLCPLIHLKQVNEKQCSGLKCSICKQLEIMKPDLNY